MANKSDAEQIPTWTFLNILAFWYSMPPIYTHSYLHQLSVYAVAGALIAASRGGSVLVLVLFLSVLKVRMTWFYVVMFGGAASVWIGLHLFYRSKRFNAPTLYLEQSSSGIVVRQYPIERMLGAKGRLIKIDSVSKIQLTKNCLSLFQQSGAAYDMWVPRRFESDLLTHTKALFPNAEFVRV